MFMELVLLLIAVYLIYDMVMRYELIKYAAKMPGDFALPFVGNILQSRGVENNKDAFYYIRDMLIKYNEHGLCRIWVGQSLMVIVWDPSFIEMVSTLTETSTKGPYYELIGQDFLRGVVASSGGREWKELRRPITHSMKNNLIVNEYIIDMVRRTNDFIHFLEEKRLGRQWDCINDCFALYADIFSDTHFGIPLNEVWERKLNYSEAYERYVKLATTSVFKFGAYYWYSAIKFTKHAASLERDRKHCMESMKWILHERERVRSENKHLTSQDNREYYTDFLLQRRIEENLSEEKICLELADVAVAGTNTTAIFTASALLYLGMFPEIQEKAYQEQMKIFGDSNRDPTADDIDSMNYLLMVFKETARIMGNPGVFKLCTKTFTLGKYTIPEGCTIFTYFNEIHRDPKYWQKPNTFYPEHFLPENEAARHRFAFVPFGIGIRMCGGKKYGVFSFLIVVSTILRNFKITTPLKFDEILYGLSFFLDFHQGYPAKFEKRNKNPLQIQ